MFLLFGINEQECLKIMNTMNRILSRKLKESKKYWGDPHDYSKEFLSIWQLWKDTIILHHSLIFLTAVKHGNWNWAERMQE